MSFFVVSWTEYACAGALTLLGVVKVPFASFPAAAKPALAAAGVCRPVARYEHYDPARLPEAEARVRALGPAAAPGLARCQNLGLGRCEEIEVTWTTVPTFRLK